MINPGDRVVSIGFVARNRGRGTVLQRKQNPNVVLVRWDDDPKTTTSLFVWHLRKLNVLEELAAEAEDNAGCKD